MLLWFTYVVYATLAAVLLYDTSIRTGTSNVDCLLLLVVRISTEGNHLRRQAESRKKDKCESKTRTTAVER